MINKTKLTMNINDNRETSASQCARIWNWLDKGGSLTSLEALERFGCARLASRIHDLKSDGKEIKKERIKLPNGKWVVRYWKGYTNVR